MKGKDGKFFLKIPVKKEWPGGGMVAVAVVGRRHGSKGKKKGTKNLK